MRGKRSILLVVIVCLLNGPSWAMRSEPILIDHACTHIARIPEWVILQAKASLHVAYGHSSHGSQITLGMTGLVAFANAGGKVLSLPKDIFAWNNGGLDGALDLHDHAMTGDVGSYPNWVYKTRAYLNDPENADVNVVMWAWCGQADGKYVSGTLFSEYLDPMNELEAEYPHIAFVYMTGRVNHNDDANNKAANQVIRDYCRANNKVLYDFADIESHDPDGVYYPWAHDDCNYYAFRAGWGSLLGNWAREWQDSHVLGVDWYQCESPHSEPLNANQKAYAAWWLFARLAGWSGAAGQAGVADLDGDGEVDFCDLSILGQNWLESQ